MKITIMISIVIIIREILIAVVVVAAGGVVVAVVVVVGVRIIILVITTIAYLKLGRHRSSRASEGAAERRPPAVTVGVGRIADIIP